MPCSYCRQGEVVAEECTAARDTNCQKAGLPQPTKLCKWHSKKSKTTQTTWHSTKPSTVSERGNWYYYLLFYEEVVIEMKVPNQHFVEIGSWESHVFFFLCVFFCVLSSISSSETFAKQCAIFLSASKTVNIQGYSELREPIKTRENCYPRIW